VARGLFQSAGGGPTATSITPRVLWHSIRGAEAAHGLDRRAVRQEPSAPTRRFGDYNKRLMRFWAEKWMALELTALQDVKRLVGCDRSAEAVPRIRARPSIRR